MKACVRVAVMAATVGVPIAAWGQSATDGSLVELAELAGFNALERAAARANQATYNQLVGPCANGAGAQCSDGDLSVFQETRELVETANELLGSGSTRYSLGLDAEGLGFALRWTAAEEMAGQGSATTRFAASQLSALATRLSVLRWGVSGLRTVRNASDDRDILLAGAARSLGAGASADVPGDFNRWGSFVDASYGYGSKDPTDLEDAFDFDGEEITVGVDYRFRPSLVAGAIVGYSAKEIDFDSSLSIVDGGIESDGFSGLVYGLWEGTSAYASASVGYQILTHDTTRRITYPSQNPTVLSVDSTARSKTDSGTLMATANAGYSWRLRAFSIDPALDVVYSDTTIDAFTETSIDNLGSGGNDPFNLQVGKQSIESLDVSPSLKLQYVFTPSFGVIIPYVVGRYHFELSDDAHVISTRYADALGQLFGSGDTDFAVSTDVPDDEYYTLAGGFTVVLPHGLNGFVQYLEVFDFDAYTDSVITAGFRFEF
ncbi:MAG TPA: autotransporter outer membrane beta-barrel domain-containing protein [Povalibacter sp.]|uniref:autotransporter outer membrane beta-barrel domain-containing protein n=1 Tax=Povalibacter sp. TaxID=1962978 RepID=UPI002C46D259|nr:autotransporter outer membrane beta-barrel domain-containing protein [Povalibacter sp.]HMN43932.1 autotransporter outer membrane beta-barrel domain-containing protein [Povalibacter sp.]